MNNPLSPAQRAPREWWIVGLLVTLLAGFLAWDGTLRRADAAFYDGVRQVDGRDPDPAILLVAIDDASLSDLPWPWPRERHAALIDRIAKAGAKAVGYDVLFLEPKPGDTALVRAMGEGVPVFLPLVVERPGLNGADHDLLQPVAPLSQVAAGAGHVGITGDPDGPVRHAWLWDGGPATGVPHMILRLSDHLGVAAPHTGDAPVLIPYTGPSDHYPAVSAGAVLRGEVPPELLRGRVVLVGATAPGLGDQHPVAVGPGGTMAGVEVQANLLDGLLHGRLIREGGAMAAFALALPLLWLMLLALRLLSPRRALLVLGALLLLVPVVSAASLLLARLWIPPATSAAVLLLVHPLWSWLRLTATHGYMTRELERLRQEPDLLPVRGEGAGLDPVSRDTALLKSAIARLRSLRAIEVQREEALRFLTHDMRSPQASILACLSTAGEGEIDAGLSTRIAACARRTLDLADGFVRLARAESGAWRREPVSLGDILIDAADDLWPLASARGIAIRTAGEDLAVEASGDRALLTRALVNLLGNAVRYSPDGGEVRLSLTVAGDTALFIVEDDGPGVAAEVAPTLFQRYSGEGIGLGLSFVEAVARGHGGRASYEGEPGKGARFLLSIAPVSAGSGEEGVAEPGSRASSPED